MDAITEQGLGESLAEGAARPAGRSLPQQQGCHDQLEQHGAGCRGEMAMVPLKRAAVAHGCRRCTPHSALMIDPILPLLYQLTITNRA